MPAKASFDEHQENDLICNRKKSYTDPIYFSGGMTHNDPDDRPAAVFGGRVTLHAGGEWESYLLLPVIPPR